MRDAVSTGLELAGFTAITAGLVIALGVIAGCLIAGGLGGLIVGWILGGDQ